MTLSFSQRSIVDQIVNVIFRRQRFPSFLLFGSPGSGKRTIAKAVAEYLGYELVEVPLTAGTGLSAYLFGSDNVLDDNMDTELRGELGRVRSCVLYLSYFEALHSILQGRLHGAIKNRSYIDGRGRSWSIDENTVIIAGLTKRGLYSRVSETHWAASCFDVRVQVRSILDADDCATIVESMISDHSVTAEAVPEAVDELYSALQSARFSMHYLSNLLAKLLCDLGSRQVIDRQDVTNVLRDDLEGKLERIIYRGEAIGVSRFTQWLGQFPDHAHRVARVIMDQIATKYYISVGEYYGLLQSLLDLSGMARSDRIVFCKWQKLGYSGERIAHELKNLGKLIVSEINVTGPESGWDDFDPHANYRFVIADDFVGSGETLSRVFDPIEDSIAARLLQHFPNSELVVLVVVGYRNGLQKVSSAAKSMDQIHIHVGRILEEHDRCTSNESTIFPDGNTRGFLVETCESLRRRHFRRLNRKFVLGFGNIASLVVFHHTVPNNTLPIIWYDSDAWMPLFPASGLPSLTFGAETQSE